MGPHNDEGGLLRGAKPPLTQAYIECGGSSPRTYINMRGYYVVVPPKYVRETRAALIAIEGVVTLGYLINLLFIGGLCPPNPPML